MTLVLVPLGAIVFLFKHWQAARHGVFLQIASMPLLFGAMFLAPKIGAPTDRIAQMIHQPFAVVEGTQRLAREDAAAADAAGEDFAEGTAAPAGPFMAEELRQEQWNDYRRRFAAIEREHAALTAAQMSLNSADPQAVAEFNRRVREYTQRLKQAQAEKRDLLRYGPEPR